MDFLLELIRTGVFGAIIYFFVILPLKNNRKFKGIPSPKTIPILGNSIDLWKAQYEFNKVLNKWAFENGTRLVIWCTSWFPLVVLGNAKDARKVLSSREHVEKGLFYKAFDLPIGTGAFNSPVNIWKQRRPHLEQGFHSKVMSRWPKVFDQCSRSLVNILKLEVADTDKSFDVHPLLNLCTMQMLIQGSFDVPVDVLGERNSPFWKQVVDSYEEGTYICEYRMLRPWLLVSDFAWNLTSYAKKLQELCKWQREFFFNLLLDSRRKTRKDLEETKISNEEIPINNLEKSHPGFLDLVLNLQQSKPELKLKDNDIMDEMISLFIAGHDAAGKSLSFTLLYLGFYPECQAKVIEELDEIFGEDREREITESDLSQMKYLECCVKEALRLMPPVSFITRKAGSDIHLEGEGIIPKGTEVAIATYLVHRDETIYPNPEAFQPERFLLENSKGRDPYAWIPFSAGPRNCMGPKFALMENKVVLANIFRNFRVESIGTKDNWVLNTNVTLKLEGGWNLKLFSRG